MMGKDKNTDNILRQALENRRGQGLPSNFSFRMMEKVRPEAEKKRKRKRTLIWTALISASALILALLAYFLIVVLDFNVIRYLPHLDLENSEWIQHSGEVMVFYYYIGFLVIILLLIDHWFRSKRRKYFDE